MKKIALALVAALALVGVAQATDYSAVGTTGLETSANYDYSRFSNDPYLAVHDASVGVQANMDVLGSVTFTAGDVQSVTTSRVNQTDFTLGYANGVKLGKLGLVAGAEYGVATGDVWTPFNGHYSSTPTKSVVGTVEANLTLGTVVPFVDYQRQYLYNDTLNLNSDAVTGGAYINFNKAVSLKVGYGHSWAARNADIGGVSLNYKF